MKYRKKPVVIDAVQLRWDTWNDMCDHAGVGNLSDGKPMGCLLDPDGDPTPPPDEPGSWDKQFNGKKGSSLGLQIPTLEGLMLAREGDWIIKGVQGEIYPCKPDIFEATYELVTETE